MSSDTNESSSPIYPYSFSPNPLFCSTCKQLVMNILERRGKVHSLQADGEYFLYCPERYYDWYTTSKTTYQDPRVASQPGECPFCGLLRQTLEANWSGQAFDSYVVAGGSRPTVDRQYGRPTDVVVLPGSPSELRVSSFQGSSVISFRRAANWTLEEFSDEAAKDYLPLMDAFETNAWLPNADSLSPEVMERARGWLAKCKSHSACRPDASFLPKRLLDLRQYDRSGVIKVVLTAQSLSKTTEYVALTYRWGRGKTLKTTVDNLLQHEKGIPTADLPRTLYDAIVVTKQLGFDFLWIDALCIIQGPGGDWSEQSTDMFNVYGHCTLNICAYEAKHSDHGFLKQLYSPRLQVATYQNNLDQSRNGDIYACFDSSKPQKQDSLKGLTERLWTLQELLVSPRTLYYTSAGIQWVCRETINIEQYDDGWATAPKWQYWKSVTSDGRGVHDGWVGIVGSATLMDLTFDTDKLPGISALAIAFANKLKYTFTAGLWRERLLADLPWSRYDDPNTTRRYSEFTAPSWSWVSLKGCVQLSQFDSVLDGFRQLQILDVVLVEESGRYGRLTGGHLDVRGIIKQISIRRQSESRNSISQGRVDYDEVEYRATDGFNYNDCIVGYLDSETDGGSEEVKCWCLCIGDCVREGRIRPERQFLLLQQLETSSIPPVQAYRRIGLARIEMWPMGRLDQPEKAWPKDDEDVDMTNPDTETIRIY